MAGASAQNGGGPRIIIIKKKGGHAAHHGGAWKVAYADFVTAMMAFFMVLWLVSQTDQETRTELSDYFRTGVFTGAPSILNGGSGIQSRGYFDVVGSSHTQPEQVTFERVSLAVRAKIAQMISEDPGLKDVREQIKVSVTEEGLLIQILDGGQNLLFDSSSAELKPKCSAKSLSSFSSALVCLPSACVSNAACAKSSSRSVGASASSGTSSLIVRFFLENSRISASSASLAPKAQSRLSIMPTSGSLTVPSAHATATRDLTMFFSEGVMV